MSSATDFWRGPFGDAYNERNKGRVALNTEFFADVLPPEGIGSAIELGCGTGENLVALSKIIRGIILYGVEVNAKAAEAVPVGNVIVDSALDFKMPNNPATFDLAFTKGFLIHVPPADLPRAYQRLYDASKRYVLIAEYFSPRREMIEYRGEKDRMWKADYGAEFQKAHAVRLVDYGFAWKHDPSSAQDNLNWWLWEKK